jgi:hypothetical protein
MLNREDVKDWIESEVGESVEVGEPNIIIYKTLSLHDRYDIIGHVIVFKENVDGPLKASFAPFLG